MATAQGAVQNAWKAYIESTYPQKSPGIPMCALVPSDPAQREAAMKSYNLLKQRASQKVVKVVGKPWLGLIVEAKYVPASPALGNRDRVVTELFLN